MKLQQLRYINEIAHQNLSVTAAADALFTSQSGVSKQVKLLESELGIKIFERQGKHLTSVTSAGQQVLEIASKILQESQNLKSLAADASAPDRGTLSIATTHTQARHALPSAVKKLTEQYPNVSLHMHQGTPMQIAEMAAKGAVDFCVATEAMELFDSLVMLPCYKWNRCVVVPPKHPLAQLSKISINDIANYPLVTYVFGFTGRSKLDKAFKANDLTPNIVFTATDSEVIKTYVKLGLGVGIVARMAYDKEKDNDLVAIDVDELFEPSTTYIGFKKGSRLRRYMYDFIQWFAPNLNEHVIDEIASQNDNKSKADLLEPILKQLATR